MDKNAISEDVNRVGHNPLHQPVPVNALVWAGEIADGASSSFLPFHGEDRGVSLAHDGVHEHVKAMLCASVIYQP